MDTDSELVEFEEDNKLQSPTDSVYSVMGIIYKLQTIADRTVLLGELRGDLTTTTTAASPILFTLESFLFRELYHKRGDLTLPPPPRPRSPPRANAPLRPRPAVRQPNRALRRFAFLRERKLNLTV